jgi:hypothetical protein
MVECPPRNPDIWSSTHGQCLRKKNVYFLSEIDNIQYNACLNNKVVKTQYDYLSTEFQKYHKNNQWNDCLILHIINIRNYDAQCNTVVTMNKPDCPDTTVLH